MESFPGDADFGGDTHDHPVVAAPGDRVVDGTRPCRGVEITARALLPDVLQHSKHSMEDGRLFAAASRWTWNSGKAKS